MMEGSGTLESQLEATKVWSDHIAIFLQNIVGKFEPWYLPMQLKLKIIWTVFVDILYIDGVRLGESLISVLHWYSGDPL